MVTILWTEISHWLILGVRFDNNVTFRDRISEKNSSLQCPKYYYSVLWIKLRFSTSSSSTRSRWQIEVARLTACRQSRFAIWHCCSSIYGPGGCWETDRQACGALTWRGRHGNVYDSPATCPNMPLQLLTMIKRSFNHAPNDPVGHVEKPMREHL